MELVNVKPEFNDKNRNSWAPNTVANTVTQKIKEDNDRHENDQFVAKKEINAKRIPAKPGLQIDKGTGYKNTLLRVKWGQRGSALLAYLVTLLYIIGSATSSNGLIYAAFLCFAIDIVFFITFIYYKNVSSVIFKRLLKEINVVAILILTISNFIIDIVQPNAFISPILGAMYLLLVALVIFLDSLYLKSRGFVISVYLLFIVLNLWNIYLNTLGTLNNGVILTTYVINNEELVLYKRSVKRFIYIEILSFSINGTYVLWKDKKMKLMTFATMNVYRKTGINYIQKKQC